MRGGELQRKKKALSNIERLCKRVIVAGIKTYGRRLEVTNIVWSKKYKIWEIWCEKGKPLLLFFDYNKKKFVSEHALVKRMEERK